MDGAARVSLSSEDARPDHAATARAQRRGFTLRPLWVLVHRWAGLSLALFLALAGLTGMLLAFYEELHAATADWVEVEPPHPGAKLLDPGALLRSAERAVPEARIDRMTLSATPGHAWVYFPAPRGDAPLGFDEVAIDPYTGREVHRGTSADLSEGMHQLMPFVFALHYELALGEWGAWLLGIVSLVWTLDCLVGFYLTLPPARWSWASWRKAWRVRLPPRNAVSLHFDWHRASGLWLWPILLVFAWSSVGFNLRGAYTPVMSALGYRDVFAQLPDRPAPADYRPDWDARLVQARALVRELGARQGFHVVAEDALGFRRGASAFEYRFTASDDLPSKRPQSRMFFDMESGRIVALKRARGDVSGQGLDDWLVGLHIASVGGRAWQIAVVVIGLATCLLSVTGVYLWWRKRGARRARAH
ncbi:PepSY-associated TM helix domain-containing protein [Lysobacter humi (ex Lee et al. 2017)]